MPEEPRRFITTVERAADVLLHFTTVDRADLGITEIASELGLSKAVVHRILTTLAAKGFVESDPESRRYRLGPEVLALGKTYLDRLDLRTLAMPALQLLSSRTEETATLSIRFGWDRLYVEQVTPDREVKMSVVLGKRFPLHAGSSSKAFLAFLPEHEREAYLSQQELTGLTPKTITDLAALREDLKETRDRGYATSYGERQADASSIAAPVLDSRGRPAAVVSVCGPLERFQNTIGDAAPLLLEQTAILSRQLGHRA